MKIIWILLAILLFCMIFITDNKLKNPYSSKGDELINNILTRTAKIIKKKYHLNPCGIGVAMPGGPIQEVTLCFDTAFPKTIEQLRELLIQVAEETLTQISSSEELQKFIKPSFFTIKNVEIIIYNRDIDGREVYDPGISTSELSQGILTYQTVDISNTFEYKQEFTETYEEGLKIIQNLKLN